MDGVIIDSGEFHFKAFHELALEHKIDLTRERFSELFGLSNGALVPKLFGRPLSENEINKYGDQKETRFRELIRDSAVPIAGAPELVRWFKGQGMRLAVASSAPKENVWQVIRSLNLADYFDAVLSAEDVTRHKPEPDVFLTAAKRIGVLPDQAWVIEDSHHGLEGARRAGMFAVGVATTHAAETLTANAVYPGLVELWKDLEAVGN